MEQIDAAGVEFILEILERGRGVGLIGDDAFRDCASLRSVNLPLELRWLGNSAFRGCGALEKVEFPGTEVRIGRNAFSDCPHLTVTASQDSAAETYAKENRLHFRRTGASLFGRGQKAAAK